MTFTKTAMQHGRGSSYPQAAEFQELYLSDEHRNSNPMESYLCLLHAQPYSQIFCYLLYLEPPLSPESALRRVLRWLWGKWAHFGVRHWSCCLLGDVVLQQDQTGARQGATGGDAVEGAAGMSCLSEQSCETFMQNKTVRQRNRGQCCQNSHAFPRTHPWLIAGSPSFLPVHPVILQKPHLTLSCLLHRAYPLGSWTSWDRRKYSPTKQTPKFKV